MKEKLLTIKGADFRIEDDRLYIGLKIKNNSNRTIHSYGCIRYIDYDTSTKTLKISLSDKHMIPNEHLIRHLKLPKFVPLEPKEITKIDVFVPLTLSRMTGKLKADKTPEIKIINIRQVKQIEVEVDYNKTPFYYNPKEPNTLKQLRQWGKTQLKRKAKVQIKPVDKEKLKRKK